MARTAAPYERGPDHRDGRPDRRQGRSSPDQLCAVRLLKNGAKSCSASPPSAGVYVAAQAVQAGVGIVGIQKMEEYLKSRRPDRTNSGG